MGLFSRSARSRPDPIDWSSSPIPAGKWAHHALPYPSTLDVVQAAIHQSGEDPTGVDRVAAVAATWRMIAKVGQDLLQAVPAAARGLAIVSERPDLSDELLWNYFTHQEAHGIAARNHLIESIFETGQAVEVLAALIRSGDLKIRLGGSDRI